MYLARASHYRTQNTATDTPLLLQLQNWLIDTPTANIIISNANSNPNDNHHHKRQHEQSYITYNNTPPQSATPAPHNITPPWGSTIVGAHEACATFQHGPHDCEHLQPVWGGMSLYRKVQGVVVQVLVLIAHHTKMLHPQYPRQPLTIPLQCFGMSQNPHPVHMRQCQMSQIWLPHPPHAGHHPAAPLQLCMGVG